MKKLYFDLYDYCFFGFTLCLSTGVGIYYAIVDRRKQSTREILLGGNKMPIIPTALSMVASFVSGISLLGVPAEIYRRGCLFWLSRIVGTSTAALLAMYVVVPMFYNMNPRPVSVYEYLERRFRSKTVRLLGSTMFMIFMIFYMGIVLYAPAVAMSAGTSVPPWVFFIAVGVVCNIYTSLGGLKAVVWTDALQAGIMLIGLATLFLKGIMDAGGFKRTVQVASKYGRFADLANWDLNCFQYLTGWTSILGGIALWSSSITFNQISVQRYLSMPSLKNAKKMMALNIPGYIIICTFCDLLGIVMFAYYLDCDPIHSKQVATHDQLVIHYALDVFGSIPGMPGLFLAFLFSGTLSTISSGINSMAAVTWEDFMKPCLGHLSPFRQAIIVKGLTLFYGSLSIVLAFSAGPMGGILESALSILGVIAGPLVGVFILGLFVPQANKFGAVVGVAVSGIISVWIALGALIFKPYTHFELPLFTDNCTNLTSIPVAASVNSTRDYSGMSPLTGSLFIYGLSPNFYSALGVILVIAVGYPVSLCANLIRRHIVKTDDSLTFVGQYRRNAVASRSKAKKEDDLAVTSKTTQL